MASATAGNQAICGLVITLEADANTAETTARLARDHTLDLGACPTGTRRLPAVIEVDQAASFDAACDRLAAISGVSHVDIAYVHFTDDLNDPIDEDDLGARPTDLQREA